jgi:hypothetical protein
MTKDFARTKGSVGRLLGIGALAGVAAVGVVATGAALGGCVEKGATMSAAEREQLRQYVSTTAPSPAHRLDADLEGKIVLLGYDLEPAEVKAGEPFTVTWYWQVKKTLEPGWRLFTHLADASDRNVLNQDGTGWIREHYQPGQWKAGEYVRDEQRITLPADWASPTLTVYVGMWSGPNRLRVVSGPTDGDNRVRGPRVDVARGPSAAAPSGAGAEPARPGAPPVPTLRAVKTATPVTIDGRLDEPAWQTAARTARFVNTMSGDPVAFAVDTRVTWDEAHVYLGWEVEDDFLKSTFRNPDDHLWEQDCVEVMFDPGGDQRNYFEIQVAPTGVSFDTRYDSRRQPQPFGDVAWNSNVRARVTPRGRVNDDGRDEGYTVEMAIPWAAFAAGNPPAGRPQHGASWGMNLFLLDARPDGGQRAAGWSPPRVGDFHALDRFGRIVFIDPTATAATAPAPGAGAAGVGAAGAGAAGVEPRGFVSPQLAESIRQRLGNVGGPADVPRPPGAP